MIIQGWWQNMGRYCPDGICPSSRPSPTPTPRLNIQQLINQLTGGLQACPPGSAQDITSERSKKCIKSNLGLHGGAGVYSSLFVQIKVWRNFKVLYRKLCMDAPVKGMLFTKQSCVAVQQECGK
jgi:hypothetical protein